MRDTVKHDVKHDVQHDVLVIGAGVVGLSTARELARRGRSVTVVDRYPPGRTGPSAAESRILRCAYGSRAWYSALSWESVRYWRELEREAGEELLVTRGVLSLASTGPDGTAGPEWEEESHSALRQLGIPAERLSPGSARRRFPGLGTADLHFVLHEPASGVLRARRAVRALAASAERRGCRFVRGTATPAAGAVLVDGVACTADTVVWAVGTALPALHPGLTSARATAQVAYYLAADSAARTTPAPAPALTPALAPAPAWIDRNHAVYGIGAFDGRGAKVVPDVGTPLEAEPPPGGHRAGPPPALPDGTTAYLRRRFPALAGLPVASVEECGYAATADEEFVLGRHPAHEHVWLVGGDSGHGFKNAPAWGKYVCDAIDGTTTVHPRWRLH
ncbi:FAD-dependent oxidoreductase [Streptomyces sp. ISL-66]|uniref:FAD-dependent oxidoreductase n=1 Tax=Streptomyces sp. ISL-66 TaxID=2819186 RepID=UPI001BE98C25|nr:FAD-dependent oxidoreductase [Streptomyces sp. ISL-66]MBT2468888.1 FAD-dependent oxidoreductase [Streptomyces sp. ISL-66]